MENIFENTDSINVLAHEISELSGEDEAGVQHKLWLEALNPGYNVTRDAINFGIDFHVYNRKLEAFYKETSGFIFETFVESCRQNKREVLHQIKLRIDNYLQNIKQSRIKILMFGDGVGSDTIYLHNECKHAAELFYFDVPGSKTFDFAVKRFKKHDINVQFITEYENIPKNDFDVIVSLELLEHVPSPTTSIKDMSTWLKPNGIALVTESFASVTPNLPTHLESNLKYAGRTPFLFLEHNLLLTYYNNDSTLKFRPMEFTKRHKIGLIEKLKLITNKHLLMPLIKHFIKRVLE